MNCSRILHIRFLLALAFAALMASSVPAQNQANPGAAAGSGTANNEVLKLLKSGMPESIVLEKIHALPGKFDISSDALIKLKTAGATEAELKAILGKGLSASETGAVTSEPVKARSVKSARANKAPHIVIEPKIVPVSTAAAKPAPTLLTVDVPLFDEKNLIGSVTGGSGMVRLTADGHTAFGVLNLAGGTNGLYRITDKGEKLRLDAANESGPIAIADITPDGSTLLGYRVDAKGKHRFFYWNNVVGLQDLGVWGNSSVVLAANGEGLAGVGGYLFHGGAVLSYAKLKVGKNSKVTVGFDKGRVWSSHELSILGASPDLDYVVGVFSEKTSEGQAFIKNHDKVGEGLGAGFYPKLVSNDGNVVFGQSDPHAGHILRWTRQGGREDLGTFGGVQAAVTHIAPDGSSVAGWFLDNRIQTHIFRWSKDKGMEDLGVTGTKVNQIADVSADGKTFVAQTVDQGATKQYLVPFADLTARREARLQEVLAQQTTDSGTKPQADEDANARAQQEARELQARVDETLADGHAANLYALAVDLEAANYPQEATQIYKYLIAKFPDDSFAVRATDRMDHAHDAAIAKAAQDAADKKAADAAQKQANDQQAQMKQAEQQAQVSLDCINKCQVTYDSCSASGMKAQNRTDTGAAALTLLGAFVPGSGGAVLATAANASAIMVTGDGGASACLEQNSSCLEACTK